MTHLSVTILSTIRISDPRAFSNISVLGSKSSMRTHLRTTDILDGVYNPKIKLSAKYKAYFKPAYIADGLA